jgi:hypothetical protein
MLKINKEFLKMKMKDDVMNWHIGSIMRMRRGGSQSILIPYL